MTEEQKLKRVRYLSRTSLKYLAKHTLKMRDVNTHTHGDMINALESEAKRKLIIMPRGSLKSSIGIVAYAIFSLLKNPNERILIDSELYTNSKNFLREIKQHLEGELLTYLFGEFKGPVWNESEIVISQRTNVYKEASITVGGIGTQKTGQHFTMILGDDYSSPSNTNSPENAEKVIAHYRYNQSILEPTGSYVIIGTRYSERDLIQFIKDNEINIAA